MPEQITPDADKTAEAKPDPRAALEKLTKSELVERVVAVTEERDAAARELRRGREAAERRGPRPEDALLVSALLDLHRAALHANRPDAARYLEAALKAGGPLADLVLAE